MDKLDLSTYRTRRLRLRAQRLLRPGAARVNSPASVLKALGGVQAQDLPAGRLSIRARSDGLTDAQIETARLEKRSIAWVWCLRGTLHLVSAEDARWLVPFLGPALIAGDRRRLHELGWDEASTGRGLQQLYKALDRCGELARPDIIQLLKENNLPWEGQAPVHLLFRAALEGRLLRGPLRGREETYVPFEPWLGEPQPLRRETALARLAERYLSAYAPAAPEDLAKWSGLRAGDTRQAFELIAGQLVPVTAAGQPAWILESQLEWLEEKDDFPTSVRLLPRFDTYLLGYASRDLALDPAYTSRVFLGGIIKPTLLVNGQVCGIWNLTRRASHLEVGIEPFEQLDDTLIPLIEAEVADIGRFLSEEVRELKH